MTEEERYDAWMNDQIEKASATRKMFLIIAKEAMEKLRAWVKDTTQHL